MGRFLKKFLGLFLAVLTVFGLASCFSPKDDGTPTGKTIFARAQELSKYCDNVPANYAEMKNATVADDGERTVTPASVITTGVRARVDELTPAYRPNALPFNISSDSENYLMNSIDTTLQWAKEDADYVKGRFQVFSSLNEWIGSQERAFRLKYDKQADRIGLEEYFDNGDNTVTYRVMSLNLIKDNKIECSFSTKVIDRNSNATMTAYLTEYVEDDYYYHIYSPCGAETFSTATFIDLKTSPVQIFNSTAVLVDGYVGQPWRKEIVLDFDGGQKIVYQEAADISAMDKPEYKPTQAIRYYGADSNIIFEKLDTEFVLDLWQLSGWSSVKPSEGNWQNGCVLTTQKGEYSVKDGWLNQAENKEVALIATPFFEDDSCFSAKFKAIYTTDITQNTITNLKSTLAEYGLALKYDYDELFAEYVNDGFDLAIDEYQFDRFDYKAMDLQSFKSVFSVLEDGTGEQFMESMQSIRVTDEIEAMERKDVSEAYAMLDTTYSGNASVDFQLFRLSIESLNVVTMANSVLFEEGGEYSLVLEMKSRTSNIEIARETKTYTGGDLTLSLSQKSYQFIVLSDFKVDEVYTLVAYISNANGLRCSEYFYPEVTTSGEAKQTSQENGQKMITTFRVNNRSLQLIKTAR